MKYLLTTLVLIFSFNTKASTVGYSQVKSDTSQTQTVTASYEEESKDEKSYSWFLNGDLSQTQSTTTTENDASVSSDWESPTGWLFGVGYDHSNDITNNIIGQQPSFKLEKKIFYGGSKKQKKIVKDQSNAENSDKVFKPYFKLKFKTAINVISQVVKTKLRPTDFKVAQPWSQVGVDWRMIEKLLVTARYKKFNYDKDIGALINRLDNPLAPRPIFAQAVTSTLSSFYNYEYSYGFTYTILESLDLELAQTKSENASSLVIGTDNSVVLTYTVNDEWQLALGGDQTSYDTGSTASSSSYNFSVTYTF